MSGHVYNQRAIFMIFLQGGAFGFLDVIKKQQVFIESVVSRYDQGPNDICPRWGTAVLP